MKGKMIDHFHLFRLILIEVIDQLVNLTRLLMKKMFFFYLKKLFLTKKNVFLKKKNVFTVLKYQTK